MNEKIYSSLDLSKSLSDFKEKVTKLLETKNLSKWSAQTFKALEAEIRNTALRLAGECVAVLLNKLSQSQEALNIAINQTRSLSNQEIKKYGNYTRQILTVGNVKVTLSLPYMVERYKQSHQKGKYLKLGFCPFLKWLGIEEGLTPLIWTTITKYGAIAGSFEAARTILTDWGVKISLKRIERLTYYFGKIGINLRQSKLSSLEMGNLPTLNVLKDQRVVIAVDGGRTRIRINKKGRRKLKTNRLGFTGEWVEPKLLTIYTVDEHGRKIRTSSLPITNDGTYLGYQEFLNILEMYLVDLGISQAKQVLLVADGAEWIWKHIPPLLEKLKCPSATYQLLDFYHAASHLHDFADAAFTTDNERQSWFKKARKALKKGQALNLMRDMGKFIASATGERCKTLIRERNYILKAYRRRLLNYPLVASHQLPLGSGAVESLIRQAVNLRMKGNGKFWLPDNAEIMLHLRCQWCAYSWDNFCNSIFDSFLNPSSA
ncbi:ISLre2 family transposase [Nostocaceae cyanobacterium CENA369]|uniref:ISLre2 family transposase n=1 Tax=Dendronalium phyllosphericum CENA369 TaxID=1725256 RepID=A0A8J7LQK9_9NOST|nr:ISLre2 family transposase [Dendronalium phyllosphericum]MBH8578229.1 ISLre2 family transposase [Dendronalium phyllosphericum CENA369]